MIEDNVDASIPPEQVAAPCEGLGDEEEEQEETEDDYAPLPPETIAASFELAKPEVIKHNDDVLVPPGQIAAPFYEEEKQEEVEGDWAPAPPETIAASYEMDGDANPKGMNEPEVIDGYNGNNINRMQDITSLLNEARTIMPENGSGSLPEIVDSNETPISRMLLTSSTSNDQASHSSMYPTPQRGVNLRSIDHVGMTIYPASQSMSESRPSFDPSHQSLPLLEATLVQDVPEEPVYDAIPINATQDKYAHGWSMRARKYRYIISGLVLSAAASIIAVVVVASSKERESNLLTDTVLTSTTSTTIVLNAVSEE